MEDKRRNKFIIPVIVIFGLTILVIVFLLFLPHKTIETLDNTQDEITHLSCDLTGAGNDYPLLINEDYDNIRYEIKVKFVNNVANEFSVVISKKYYDVDSAKSFVNKLQTNFNIYTGERQITHVGLNPVYSSIDNIGKMVLLVEREYLSYDNASLLMLDSDIINKSDLSDYKDFFLGKNYICNTK